MKVTFFIPILLSFCLNGKAQKFESFSALKLENNLSYTSQTLSSSKAPLKPSNPNIKVIVSPAPTGQNVNSGIAIFGVLKTLKIQPAKEKMTFTFETKRIIDKKGSIDIDTDVPSADNRFSQSALDFYLQQLNLPKKIVLEKTNFVSNSAPEASIGGLPPLHVINELSGIFVNYYGRLSKESSWVDTVTNNSGKYINVYKVINLDGTTGTVQLKGSRIASSDEGFNQHDETEMLEKIKKGGDIEAKAFIGKSEYAGELTINTETYLINEMKLRLSKEETLSVFGQRSSKTYEMNYIVTNKVK